MGECNCIAETNAFLAQHNAEVLHNIFGTPRALVTLTKVDEKKRGKVPLMQGAFCPFCGAKYPEPDADDQWRPAESAQSSPQQVYRDYVESVATEPGAEV